MLADSLLLLAHVLGILLALVLSAALLTWAERRLLGLWQDRLGPNRAGKFGLLQVLADVIKLLTKDEFIPPFADRVLFVLAPVIVMTCMLLIFAVVPFAPGVGIIDSNIGLLFFFSLSSLAVYGVLLAGLASNNKYALLGGLRAAAQTLSYEVFMGLSLMGVVMMAGSFNLRDIVIAQTDGWYIVPQCLGFIVFLVAGVAEAHRLPFDLPEAEHELTAGFHTEYSGMKFGMFFLGEYLGVILISALIVTLFFGGWQGPWLIGHWLPPLLWFVIKTLVFIVFFVLLRAAIPRPRYDQLMAFGWLVMLPVSLVNLLITALVLLW